MMQTVVTDRGFTTEVRRGEVRAVAGVRPVRIKVATMRGPQHHRGFVGTIAMPGATQDCGHRLHVKRSAARACAVAVAKRLVRA